MYPSPVLSQLCLSWATDPIYPDLWTDFLAWLWTYLVTMNLPGNHWAVYDYGYGYHTQSWLAGLHSWLDHWPALITDLPYQHDTAWCHGLLVELGHDSWVHPARLTQVLWVWTLPGDAPVQAASPLPLPDACLCLSTAQGCTLLHHRQLRELIQPKGFNLCVDAESEP